MSRRCLVRVLVVSVAASLTFASQAHADDDDVVQSAQPAPTDPPPSPESSPAPEHVAPEPEPVASPSHDQDHGPPSFKSAHRARPPKNAISLQVLSLLNSGVAVQYERFVAPPLFSLAGSVGYRRSGGADFDVVEGTIGAEARWWLLGKDGFSRFDSRAMVGPFLGARLDFGYTDVSDARDDRSLGKSLCFAHALLLGVRVTLAHRVEITPSFGVGLRHEIDPSGRLATWSRPELLRFGLTAGVLF